MQRYRIHISYPPCDAIFLALNQWLAISCLVRLQPRLLAGLIRPALSPVIVPPQFGFTLLTDFVCSRNRPSLGRTAFSKESFRAVRGLARKFSSFRRFSWKQCPRGPHANGVYLVS